MIFQKQYVLETNNRVRDRPLRYKVFNKQACVNSLLKWFGVELKHISSPTSAFTVYNSEINQPIKFYDNANSLKQSNEDVPANKRLKVDSVY